MLFWLIEPGQVTAVFKGHKLRVHHPGMNPPADIHPAEGIVFTPQPQRRPRDLADVLVAQNILRIHLAVGEDFVDVGHLMFHSIGVIGQGKIPFHKQIGSLLSGR